MNSNCLQLHYLDAVIIHIDHGEDFSKFYLASEDTIFAETLEKIAYFFLFSLLQCSFLVRLHSVLGHNQAAKWLSFKSGDSIFGPTLFGGGARDAEKSVR